MRQQTDLPSKFVEDPLIPPPLHILRREPSEQENREAFYTLKYQLNLFKYARGVDFWKLLTISIAYI